MAFVDHTQTVLELARSAGFDRAGIAPVRPLPRRDYVDEWLDAGRGGEMDYLRRYRELRADPIQLLPGARSILVVADNYRQPVGTFVAGPATLPAPAEPARGRIAQYAWGRDYHKVLRRKLHRLADAMHAAIDEPFQTRVCVDTAPLIEREAAALAGIGWIGKNTLVLHHELGSFFFLGEILTTLALAPSALVPDHCGTCTRCLEACPTGALTAPYQMDATRCISYLTIEHRGEIPRPLQPLMEDWVFGCDVCQEVCPYNREAPIGRESAYRLSERHPLPPAPMLSELIAMSPEAYQEQLAGSAMKRATLEMLRRNARVALDNCGGSDAEQAESTA